VIQFTPPGSGCSVIFGKNVTAAAPGSAQGLYLIVADIAAARDELLGRGVEISEVFHDAGDVHAGADEPYLFGRLRVSGPDPDHRSYRSFVSFRRSGRQRLAVPGGHRPIARPRGRGRHDIHLVDRARERAPACRGRARRAREADRPARCELAGLVRRVHRPGAGRQAAAIMSSGDDVIVIGDSPVSHQSGTRGSQVQILPLDQVIIGFFAFFPSTFRASRRILRALDVMANRRKIGFGLLPTSPSVSISVEE